MLLARVDGNKLTIKSPAIVIPTSGLTSVVQLEFVKADQRDPGADSVRATGRVRIFRDRLAFSLHCASQSPPERKYLP